MPLVKYARNFFTPTEVGVAFKNADNDQFPNHQHSLKLVHENLSPYDKIHEALRQDFQMERPLCIQSFSLKFEKATKAGGPHFDFATSMYPSIVNVWFCETSQPGRSFAVLDQQRYPEIYERLWDSISTEGNCQGVVGNDEVDPFDSAHFDKYTGIYDYELGDVLFFNSRQLHRREGLSPRRTIVLKFIDEKELMQSSDSTKDLVDYSKIHHKPHWSRYLLFDRLRFFDSTEQRKKFLYDTRHLLD